MRAIVLTNDQPNQHALCHKLSAAGIELAAVVLSRNIPRKPPKRPLRLMANRVEQRIVGRPFVKAWADLRRSYREAYPGLPAAPEQIRVANVNDAEVIAAITRHAPDLVIVSGTNLVGRKVMEASSVGAGIVNLHTGLSPYIKGGPNCTNWCLAERAYHLIGNTVMWLDLGIDSGPILATERTQLTGRESLTELHWKVMEHAHDLYVRAVVAIAQGRAVARVPQDDLAAGRTFYMAEWTARRMVAAYRNFAFDYSPAHFDGPSLEARLSGVRLIPLAGRS